MLRIILLGITTVFFGLNMGASGIAPSFAAGLGANLIKRKHALILFGIFVVLGGISLGKNVTLTLGRGLIPKEFINLDVALIILFSATLSLFLANILNIPQSTSQVTVGSIVGAGMYFRHLKLSTLCFKILPMWVLLPSLSFVLTLLLYKNIYPPEHDNLHIYHKIFANQKKLRISSLITSCYVAYAIGTNNVANVIAPLYGVGILSVGLGLMLLSPLFGIGAWLMGKGTLKTAGQEIVPLGLMSGTLVSFVTATLLLLASILGIPQSLVQLNLFSIFAISCVKNGHRYTLDRHITRKTFMVWTLTPFLAVSVTFLLLALFRI